MSATPETTDPNATTPGQLQALEAELVQLYLDRNELALAGALQARLVPEKGSETEGTAIQGGTRTGHLQALLDGWQEDPDQAPSQASLDAALLALRRRTPTYRPDAAQLRPLLDYVFDRKRRADTLGAADFLFPGAERPGRRGPGRCSVCATSAGVAGGGPTGRRPGPERHDPERHRCGSESERCCQPARNGEASRRGCTVLTLLVRSVPWNSGYRLRLGQARLATSQPEARTTLATVAAGAQAEYRVRLDAARALSASGAQARALGSGELDLLAGESSPRQRQRNSRFSLQHG